jgi:hypothetical protein
MRAGLDLRNRLLWKLAPPYATAISSPDEPEIRSMIETRAAGGTGAAIPAERGAF